MAGMRTAEVTLNQKCTFMVNDQEHKAFKLACVEAGEDMGRALRELQRRYVREHKEAQKAGGAGRK
jgi:hypothetical protein